ncbi:MAG: ABC-F family ATP-binding cassette domain-containing protein [Chloroflexi bacterium]|nr:ABC-F family ATP-binding cassette domain-containing protein [Chloroflexota bacterium]
MLKLANLKKSFGAREVLATINLEVGRSEKIALVGPNGAGKTTLLKIVRGDETADEGQVRMPSGWLVGYLPQDAVVTPGRTLWDEMFSAYGELLQIQRELHEIEQQLIAGPEADELIRLCDEQGDLMARFEQLGGYSVEAEIHQILAGLGFSDADKTKETRAFSGGWQSRIALAKLLVRKPDILLLDEPTNHLDLEATEWLEGYLAGSPSATIIVSHDRYFLDRAISRTVELEDGKLTDFRGNYTFYLAEKERRRQAAITAYERQQKFLQQQQAFLDRFRAKATKSAQVKSREKMLAKLARLEPPKDRGAAIALRFPTGKPSHREVVTIDGLKKSFGEHVVFDGLNASLERGDRIALVGPNGAGKSTLLKLLAGLEKPDSGHIQVGEGVTIGYYAQDQAAALRLDRTIVEEMREHAPEGWGEERVRSLLGRFLFTQDEVEKEIEFLSGGEKSRLSLAKLLLRPCNLLLLDEPTNHLDISSREQLEAALRSFAGTVVIASHDRYFMDQVTTKVGEVGGGTIAFYLGNYTEYRERQIGAGAPRSLVEDLALEPVATTNGKHASGKRHKNSVSPGEREMEHLDAELERVANRRKELEDILGQPDQYGDREMLNSMAVEYAALDEEAAKLEARWEELAQELLVSV